MLRTTTNSRRRRVWRDARVCEKEATVADADSAGVVVQSVLCTATPLLARRRGPGKLRPLLLSPNSDSAAAVAPGRPHMPGDAVVLHTQRYDSARDRPALVSAVAVGQTWPLVRI
jgi:hypothetical protein